MSIAETMQQAGRSSSCARYGAVREQIGRVIVGHDDIVHGVLTCLFVGGHCLLEGVPGLGKTLLVRTLAKTLDLDFSRIQFTPDLMPADILGTNMVMETPDGKRFFEFQRGPIFTQICLADEINRATPKTQSAMLETMQEGSVTHRPASVYQLEQPFFVMATQNPIEQEGTYPLPEAQLDRFFFKLVVGYSSREELATIVDRTTRGETIEPRQGDGRRRDPPVAAAGPRSDPGPARAGLHRAADAGHASRRPVRPADHEPVSALGRQPARRADAGAGREGAGAAGRPLQRQLRGRAARLPAGPAASRDPQLRGPGRGDQHRPGAARDPGKAAGESRATEAA